LHAQLRVDKYVAPFNVQERSQGQTDDPPDTVSIAVAGATPFTLINPGIIYPLGQPAGWLRASVANATVNLSLRGAFLPVRGTYYAYVDIRVGVAAARVLVKLTVTPSDNQFQFLDANGNDLNFNGLSLRSTDPPRTIRIRYVPQLGEANIPAEFVVGSRPSWLQVSPSSGKLDSALEAPLTVSVAPDAQPSSTTYQDALAIFARNNPNKSGSLLVSAQVNGLVPGTELTSGSMRDLTLVEGNRLYNGEFGYFVNVPTGTEKLSILTSLRDVQLYASYGFDVYQSGGQVVADAGSTPVNEGVLLEMAAPSGQTLTPGPYYIGLYKILNGESSGFISATLKQKSACSYTLSPTSTVVTAAAFSGSFQLRTDSTCSWQASTSSSWITLDPSTTSGYGDRAILFNCLANPGDTRTGQIIAGGQTFTITQNPKTTNPPLITRFTSTPGSVPWGSASVLEWAVSNAGEVKLDGESVSSSGARAVNPAQNATYTLTATNTDGATSATATVSISGRPAGGRGILRVSPNPVLMQSHSGGTVDVSWLAPPAVQAVEIRVGSPDGARLTTGQTSGSVTATDWMQDGTVFYLVDVTNGKPANAANTLDTVTLRIAAPGERFFGSTSAFTPVNAASGVAELTWNAPGYSKVQIRVGDPSGSPMTGELTSSGSTLTGDWAGPGIPFFLQDASSGDSSGSGRTIASVIIPKSVTPNPTPVPPDPGGNNQSSFWAEPNPIVAPSGSGKTVLRWKVTTSDRVQVRVGSPDGTPMTGVQGAESSAETGDWVTDGTRFFLQDARSGDSAGAARTILDLTVRVVRQ
jgi:hypothetical protein